MKMICKKHGIQEIVFYLVNGRINRKCIICQLKRQTTRLVNQTIHRMPLSKSLIINNKLKITCQKTIK